MNDFDKNVFRYNLPPVGVFWGFYEKEYQYLADIGLELNESHHKAPLIGTFILIDLEDAFTALLARVILLEPVQKAGYKSGLCGGFSEIQYVAKVRILGVLKDRNQASLPEGKPDVIFIASHRRMPALGTLARFAGPEVLKAITEIPSNTKMKIGYLGFGEYLHENTKQRKDETGNVHLSPEIPVYFDMKSFIGTRSFLFARSGFGKSNLNKVIFANVALLHKKIREGEVPSFLRKKPSVLLFDMEGEYFWPDQNERPGLCNIETIKDEIEVFTEQKHILEKFNQCISGNLKINLRSVMPEDVFPFMLTEEQMKQVNSRKLIKMNQELWIQVIDEYEKNNDISDITLNKILYHKDSSSQNEKERQSARSNLLMALQGMHSIEGNFFYKLFKFLSEGKVCIVDVSHLESRSAFIFISVVIKKIYDHNVDRFTSDPEKMIPVITVLEEAQKIFAREYGSLDIFYNYVKEGRKYDLGMVMITQQPGTLPREMMSQGDNWFLFHLLSADDLDDMNDANTHFSKDILTSVANEAITGQGYFWSSASGKPFPIPFRAMDFAQLVVELNQSENKDDGDKKENIVSSGSVLQKFNEEESKKLDKLYLSFIKTKKIKEDQKSVTKEAPKPDDYNFSAIVKEISIKIRNMPEIMERLHSEEGLSTGTFRRKLGELLKGKPMQWGNMGEFITKVSQAVMTYLYGEKREGWLFYKKGEYYYFKAKIPPKI